jgi:hypothetical protein
MFVTGLVFAGPESTSYELKEYGFGSGGSENNSSTNYSMFGIIGEQDGGSLDSTTYGLQSGLTFSLQSNLPDAPSFTNPDLQYDRLKFVLNDGNNPTDSTFAIANSTDRFATTQYIQSDFTIGSAPAWLTYSGWGGLSGQYVTGLSNNTTYEIKVKARQGNFTESGFSESANASTSDPFLTFSVDSNTLTFDHLNPSNSFTDSSKSTVLTMSTNAYNGYIIYGFSSGPLDATYIPDYSGTNGSPTTWTGSGFGYSTNDSDLQTGGTNTRFTGLKYAGFSNSAPGDPVADHLGPILTSISGEQFTISYRVTALSTAPAATYQTNVTYIIVPSY